MSAQSIQRKIDNAHKKIGKALGYDYGIYRALYNSNVLDEANLIDVVKSSFTLSDTYTTALSWQMPVWVCYSDSSQLESGDFLYSEDQGRTFFILDRQPHLPVLALEVNDRINIKTTGYADDGDGWRPDATVMIAENLPCYLNYGSTSMGGMVPARSASTSGFRTATIVTTLPREKMVMGMSITNGEFTGDVISYNYANFGVGLQMTCQEFVSPQ